LTPGPGQYGDGLGQGPVFSKKGFGVGFVSGASKKAPFETRHINTGPGPGSYYLPDQSSLRVQSARISAPSSEISSKKPSFVGLPKRKVHRTKPVSMLGPGYYEPTVQGQRTLQGIFSKAEKGFYAIDPHKTEEPGPNYYMVRPISAKNFEFHIGNTSSFMRSQSGHRPRRDQTSMENIINRSKEMLGKTSVMDSIRKTDSTIEPRVEGTGINGLTLMGGTSPKFFESGRLGKLIPGPGAYLGPETRTAFQSKKLMVTQPAFMSEVRRQALGPELILPPGETIGPTSYDPYLQSKKVSFHRNAKRTWV
jgi:hypothetical protein